MCSNFKLNHVHVHVIETQLLNQNIIQNNTQYHYKNRTFLPFYIEHKFISGTCIALHFLIK